jgi:hypothetical protein
LSNFGRLLATGSGLASRFLDALVPGTLTSTAGESVRHRRAVRRHRRLQRTEVSVRRSGKHDADPPVDLAQTSNLA